MHSDDLTGVGPCRIDISIVVIGQFIGTCFVEVQSDESLLQSSVDTLQHGDDSRLCIEFTHDQGIHSALSDVSGGCLHIFTGHCRAHRYKTRGQLIAFLRRDRLD